MTNGYQAKAVALEIASEILQLIHEGNQLGMTARPSDELVDKCFNKVVTKYKIDYRGRRQVLRLLPWAASKIKHLNNLAAATIPN